MKIHRGLARAASRPRCLAIGVFDGVHLGHRRILREAVTQARRLGAVPAVVTFEPHPDSVLRPGGRHPVLLSLRHRLRLIGSLGMREAYVVRFNRAFSRVSAERFLRRLTQGLGMRAICIGHDFRFGHRGEGDAAFLRARAAAGSYRVVAIPALRRAGGIVSSTRIRRLILAGRLREAAALLGRPVSIYGNVVRGRGRGRRLGFPTANLNPHHETLPPPGVYAVRAVVGGRRRLGVVHRGPRPTFGDRETVEVHFPGFHGDLYGRELELEFVARLRPIRRFAGPAALQDAIRRDVESARQIRT